MTNSLPPHIPDFELLRCIGQGSYGEVWLARSVTGVFRAIKIVKRSTFNDDRPYEKEFSGIKKFEPVSRRHETQLDVLHVGRNDADGFFYYVMELADDERTGRTINPNDYKPWTLRSHLGQGRLPLQECLDIALHLAAALDHLHENGLVHRDVKPSNIVFINGVPKLADIGLVTDTDESRSFAGTDGYIPPEGAGTRQADLYSLGKVLYEISTGRSRFDFPELPTNIRDFPEQVALLQLNEVILQACEEEKSKRYQTAKELAADLWKIKNGKPIRPKRDRWKAIIASAAICSIAPFIWWNLDRTSNGKSPSNFAKIISPRNSSVANPTPMDETVHPVGKSVVLYQTDFEPPLFRPGGLAGQDGWHDTAKESKNAAQIVIGKSGQQLLITGAATQKSGSSYYASFAHSVDCEMIPENTDHVSVSADFNFSPGASSMSAHNLWAFLIPDDQDRTAYVSIGVDKTELVFGQNFGNPNQLAAAGKSTNAFHTLRIDLDFQTRMAAFFLDGVSFGSTDFNPKARNCIGSINLVLQSSAPIDAALLVDNISVIAWPVSHAVALTPNENLSFVTPEQTNGLVAWWPANGQARDIIGGNLGKLRNGAAYAAGWSQEAFDLRKANSYVEIPDNPALNPKAITVEAWIYRYRKAGPYDPIVKKSNRRVDGSYALEFNENELSFFVFTTGWQGVRGDTPVPFNQWCHVAGTYDGTNLNVFVNGQRPRALFASGGAPGAINATASPLGVGSDLSNEDRFFIGKIDELKVYNRALSQAELHASLRMHEPPTSRVHQRTPAPGLDIAVPKRLSDAAVSSNIHYTFVPMTEGKDSDSSPFHQPTGLAPDNWGNIFFTDTSLHALYKIDSTGAVTVFAGQPGFQGKADGIGGTAGFNAPASLAIHRLGTIIYVADTMNHTVRRITTTNGMVTTIAGVAAKRGSADGVGTSARFNCPSGVTVDTGGNLFVADTHNHTIRRITQGGAVETIAGVAGTAGHSDGKGMEARFQHPSGMAVDLLNNVFVADSSNHTIRKISKAGVVTTFAGTAGKPGFIDGTGAAARFRNPQAVTVDNLGNVFVADSGNHVLRKISKTGKVTTIAGVSSGQIARFKNSFGIALDAMGSLFVSDKGNQSIQRGRTSDELWRYDWLISRNAYEPNLEIPGHAPFGWIPGEMPPDKYQNIPHFEGPGKRSGFIVTHPLGPHPPLGLPKRPALLKFTGTVSPQRPILTVEASSHIFGDSLLQCVVNGKKIGEYTVVGYKWTTCTFDLSPFLSQPFELELWNFFGGKHADYYEHCYIDKIEFKPKTAVETQEQASGK